MRWDLTLERRPQYRLNEAATKKALKAIAEVAERNKSLGFEARVGRLAEPVKITDESQQEVYRYLVRLRIVKENSRNPEVAQKQFQHVLGLVQQRAAAKGWSVLADRIQEDKQEKGGAEGKPEEVMFEPRRPFRVPDLTEEVMATHFTGVYERDAHIRVIHDCVTMMQRSDGDVLPHVLLYGEPGAAKTVLMEKFKKWFDEEGTERVGFVDGTTMTKAGLERWMIDQAENQRLPEVLVVDELEKQPMDNLLGLNNVMASGVLTRCNANVGNLRVPARFLVVGLCNDEQALKNFRNGALWSRFAQKLGCVRPSRELCLLILSDIVHRMGGNPEWATLALEFGYDVLGQRDIREIKGHLAGRDRLLDFTYQADKSAIEKAKHDEDSK